MKLSSQDYPQLVEWLNKERHTRSSFNLSQWEKVEERVNYQQQKLFQLAEQLFLDNQIDISFSIIKRNNLASSEFFQKNEKLKEEFNKNTNFKYFENRILQNDGFGPTEEICLGEKPSTYIHVSDFNLQKEQIFFINDSQDKNFDFAFEHLVQQKQIGFDSETAVQNTPTQDLSLALLQMSSMSYAFLFDIHVLKNDEKLIKNLNELFTNPNIQFIGHTVKYDIKEIEKNLKFKTPLNENKFLDIAEIEKNLKKNKDSDSLAYLCLLYLKINKKLSKHEQISNWIIRPLRQCQIHYAALDALTPLLIYQQQALLKLDLSSAQEKSPKKVKYQQIETRVPNQVILIEQKFKYSQKYQDFFNEPTQIKFIIDNMLGKLVKYFRNIGIDTEHIINNDPQLLMEKALNQKRVIVTRDAKFFNRKQLNIPTFYITNTITDTKQQFKEVINFFKIQPNNDLFLSRCVKCNSLDLQITNAENNKNTIITNFGNA